MVHIPKPSDIEKPQRPTDSVGDEVLAKIVSAIKEEWNTSNGRIDVQVSGEECRDDVKRYILTRMEAQGWAVSYNGDEETGMYRVRKAFVGGKGGSKR